jgi:serine phosphatase RsbU (regulator of sigma subunit)
MPFLFKREGSHSSPLSPPAPATIPDLQGAAFSAFYYGQRKGGDFYDFVPLSNGHVLFTLLDVAGPQAQNRAIICAMQNTFRTEGAALFAGADFNESESMIELSIRLNRSILAAENGLRSCPTFVGCYAPDSGIIWYANSGHTAGLVRDGNGVTELSATGLPLGLFSHAPSDACVVALEPGAGLLLVSRGVIEGKRKGEEFGLDRVKEVFQQTAAESAKELCLTVLNGLRQFMNTPPTHDDVTAVALVRASK